jgi:hypothetical protein
MVVRVRELTARGVGPHGCPPIRLRAREPLGDRSVRARFGPFVRGRAARLSSSSGHSKPKHSQALLRSQVLLAGSWRVDPVLRTAAPLPARSVGERAACHLPSSVRHRTSPIRGREPNRALKPLLWRCLRYSRASSLLGRNQFGFSRRATRVTTWCERLDRVGQPTRWRAQRTAEATDRARCGWRWR